MSVTSATTAQASYTPPNSQQIATFKNDLQQLAQALQSGNLGAAQQAYATLSQFISQNPPPGGTNGQSDPLSQALSQVGSALQSGNVGAAQQAFSALQAGGHGHGGGGGSGGGSGSSSSSSSSTIVSQTTTTSPGGVITTVTTYANGTQETSTSYGPAPTSSQSVIA
jgi:hypothetical protein